MTEHIVVERECFDRERYRSQREEVPSVGAADQLLMPVAPFRGRKSLISRLFAPCPSRSFERTGSHLAVALSNLSGTIINGSVLGSRAWGKFKFYRSTWDTVKCTCRVASPRAGIHSLLQCTAAPPHTRSRTRFNVNVSTNDGLRD